MYKNLEFAMNLKGITKQTILVLLGISQKALFNKFQGESDWKLWEAMKVKDLLFPEYELAWLFATDKKAAA